MAILPLALCGILVAYGWRENYGDAKLDAITGIGNALHVIKSDSRVFFLGLAQSAFEGSMYTFVFMWTPAIATAETKATLPWVIPISTLVLLHWSVCVFLPTFLCVCVCVCVCV